MENFLHFDHGGIIKLNGQSVGFWGKTSWGYWKFKLKNDHEFDIRFTYNEAQKAIKQRLGVK